MLVHRSLYCQERTAFTKPTLIEYLLTTTPPANMDQVSPDLPATPNSGSEEKRRSARLQRVSSTRSSSFGFSAGTTPTISPSRNTPADKAIPSTTKEGMQDIGPDPTPSKRPGLRIRNTQGDDDINPLDEAMKPLTDDERRNWKGWVDLESDPVSYTRAA